MLKIFDTEIGGEVLAITALLGIMFFARHAYFSEMYRTTGQYILEIQNHKYILTEYKLQIIQPACALLIMGIGGRGFWRLLNRDN